MAACRQHALKSLHQMTTLKIEIPKPLLKVFRPKRGDVRYRAAYGGRSSGKSFTFAKMAAIFGAVEPLRILCCREFMNSIKESFHAELKNAIASDAWLSSQYDVGIDYIRGKAGTAAHGTEFIFRGLRNNIGSIKSLAQIDICIIEEAEDTPERSWIDLEPTIRAPKSEIWVIWNPKKRDSAVDKRFRGDKIAPRAEIAQLNYHDNPWFSPELEELRKHQEATMEPAMYRHIWHGDYLEHNAAQVFANKYIVEGFEVADDWDGPYCGLDFGFAQDPTAAVECFIHNKTLYIRREAGKVGLELDDTAQFIIGKIPSFAKKPVRADSARPESISYLRRGAGGMAMQGIVACKKGKGSVEDGVAFINSFVRVVIHSDCKEVASEFLQYSYKVDRNTGDVLDVLVDAHNHYIDAIRYALEPIMNHRQATNTVRIKGF